MSDNIVTLDVREVIRSGGEPFTKIMGTVAQLQPGQQFRIIAPFEPVPLFHVLGRQGFHHAAGQLESGDWEVLFTRNGEVGVQSRDVRDCPNGTLKRELQPAASKRSEDGSSSTSISNVIEVDARGLEPPQPMEKILEALPELPDHAELRARTDRRPMHLYAQLEARGFVGETEEQNDGSFLTHIHPR